MFKRYPFLLVLVLGIPIVSHAGWMRTYGEGRAYFVQQTKDGGYIAVGEIRGGFGNILLVRTDSLGDSIWTRTYGDTTELVSDYAMCVRETKDSGYVMLCYTSSFVGDPPASLYLMKTDYKGDSVWAHSCGELTEGSSFEKTSDGGYIVTGMKVVSPTRGVLWLLKTDSFGEPQWTREYWAPDDAWGMYVEQTSDSGYIITGCWSDPSSGFWRLWLLKTDSNGDTLWTKSYVDLESSEGHTVEQTTDGGYMIVGRKDTLSFGKIWLLKTDENGDTLWTQTYERGWILGFRYFGRQTRDGGYIITGTVELYNPLAFEQVYLIKTDSLGNQVWDRHYGWGGAEYGYCVQQTREGGYIIAGYTGMEFWLIKTYGNGDIESEIEESSPVQENWEVATSIGSEIILRYADQPAGFHAEVYDAAGRKVDVLHSNLTQGTIVWGEGHPCGVYFIRSDSGGSTVTQRVVLLK